LRACGNSISLLPKYAVDEQLTRWRRRWRKADEPQLYAMEDIRMKPSLEGSGRSSGKETNAGGRGKATRKLEIWEPFVG
jgi:hypothetical protein